MSAFITSPSDTQIITVNGILYQYNAANTSWTRVAAESIDIFGRNNTNTAFLQANSSYAQANSAALYANGAFIQANSSYGQANSAASYANAAFLQANSVYALTNTNTTYIQTSISPFLLMGA